jgi:cbb3-type cytochrome oxidase subunit 3
MELVRSLITVAAFGAFLAIVWWAYAPSRRARWERAGRLQDDEPKTGTDHVFGQADKEKAWSVPDFDPKAWR